jgi:hypothetical protein
MRKELIFSGGFPVFQRQHTFLLRVKQDDFHNHAVFGIADVGVPALRDFAHDKRVGHADLKDVVVFEVGAFIA